MRILNNTKIRKNSYLNKVWSIEFHCYISLFHNVFNRLSLLADPLLIPSTIITCSRHSMGYDLLCWSYSGKRKVPSSSLLYTGQDRHLPHAEVSSWSAGDLWKWIRHLNERRNPSCHEWLHRVNSCLCTYLSYLGKGSSASYHSGKTWWPQIWVSNCMAAWDSAIPLKRAIMPPGNSIRISSDPIATLS